MDTFTIIILILLILSIANNLIMYNKCYLNNQPIEIDVQLVKMEEKK